MLERIEISPGVHWLMLLLFSQTEESWRTPIHVFVTLETWLYLDPLKYCLHKRHSLLCVSPTTRRNLCFCRSVRKDGRQWKGRSSSDVLSRERGRKLSTSRGAVMTALRHVPQQFLRHIDTESLATGAKLALSLNIEIASTSIMIRSPLNPKRSIVI